MGDTVPRRWSSIVPLVLALSLSPGCTAAARKARALERGDKQYDAGNTNAAIIQYRNVLKYDSNNAHAIGRLGLLYFGGGELGQAYAFLNKAKELDPSNTEVRLKLGAILLLARQPEKARDEANFVLAREPDNLGALSLMADTSENVAELDKAIQTIEQKRASLGDPEKVARVLGALYLRKHDIPHAEAALKDAVAAAPKSVQARISLANLYQAKGEVEAAEKELQTAASADSKDPVGKLRLADFYLQQRKIDEAKRVLAEITTAHPDYLPAWLRTAEVAIAEKRFDDASKALAVVFDKSPKDRTGLMLRGQVQLAQNRTDEAIQTYQSVIKDNPSFPPARVRLATAQLQAGNTEQAKSELRQALETAPNYAEAVFLLAELNIRTGTAEVAIEDLNKFLAHSPRAARGYELLGAAYLQERQAARATAAFRKRLELAPQDVRGQYLVATSLRAEGKTQEARKMLEDILAKEPEAADALGQLVVMDFAEKKPDVALAQAKKQLEKAPNSAPLQYVLGGVYQRRGELGPATEAYNKAIALDPSYFGPYKDLSQIYMAQGKVDDALPLLAKAQAIQPRDPSVVILEGMVYQQKADFPKAQAAYERAWKINPNSAVTANNLAWILAHKTGDAERALTLAQKAKELAPQDPSISDTLGWILYARGVYERAANLLKEATEKLPQNAEIRYHYGMALLQIGDKAGARHELTQALAGNPSFEGVEKAKEALAQLK
jgi:tetratricopeptide (TPR) repeat protein